MTTPPTRVSSVPSNCVELPLSRPPPWMKTNTDLSSPGATPAGRQTLRNRQSSISERGPLKLSPAGQGLPNEVAARSSVHGAGGTGGAQRSASTGGAA